MKRYEIYLPLKYNDGREIEAEKFKQIREELIAAFGALTVSSQSAPYQGRWKYGGVNFIDDIIKIEIIAGGDRKTERFFKEFKERLKRILKQIDILITAQNIRTMIRHENTPVPLCALAQILSRSRIIPRPKPPRRQVLFRKT